jgi:hypothetical protein
MPTAAKLVAALAFAGIAFLAALVYVFGVPERTVWGQFVPVSAAIGGLCGWMIMGRLAGQGYRAAMGYGLRTVATFVFWVLVAFATWEMLMRSIKMRYSGPMEAILGIFDFMLEFAQPLLNVPMGTVLIAGGIIGGCLTEWASRRWS